MEDYFEEKIEEIWEENRTTTDRNFGHLTSLVKTVSDDDRKEDVPYIFGQFSNWEARKMIGIKDFVKIAQLNPIQIMYNLHQ